MNDYTDGIEAVHEWHRGGGAMNYYGIDSLTPRPEWMVGSVEEIEEATGTSWQDATKHALYMALKPLGVTEAEVAEVMAYLSDDAYPASGVDTHAVSEELGLDHAEAWERFCRDYTHTEKDKILASLYDSGHGMTADWPEHMTDRSFVAWMYAHADDLPRDGYTHYI